MTLSFNPSNSSDSLSLVAGLTADKGAKNGGFPGVGSFMELLNALEQIKPRAETGSLFSEEAAESGTAYDLPTGKELPDDLPALPEGAKEHGSISSPELPIAGKTATVIPFPGMSPDVIPGAPAPSGDAAETPATSSNTSNSELAPAAASPIASLLVLADRSVNAAAIPSSSISKDVAGANGVLPTQASDGPDAAPPHKTNDSAVAATQAEARSASSGEGVQVRIAATPEAHRVWTGGPALVSLSTADVAKPQVDPSAVAKGEGLQVQITASQQVRPLAMAPVLPTLANGKAVDAPQLSSSPAALSSNTPSIARVELQAFTNSARSEPTSEAEISGSTSTNKPTATVQAKSAAPTNPLAATRAEVTSQSSTRSESLAAPAQAAEPKPGNAPLVSDQRVRAQDAPAQTRATVAAVDQARAERPQLGASVVPTPRTAQTAKADQNQIAPSPVSSKEAEVSRGGAAPLIQSETSVAAKTTDKPILASKALPNAELAKPVQTSVAAPVESISNPVRPITASTATTSIDTFADVERVVEQIISARQVDLSKPASVALAHREFGALTLTFDQQASGKMNVEIASEDGDVQRALAAAIAQDRGSSRNGELGAQLSQSSGQPTPTMSDRGGSFGSSGSASGQSNADDNRSQNSAQRDPHGERAAHRHEPPAQNPSDDALYA